MVPELAVASDEKTQQQTSMDAHRARTTTAIAAGIGSIAAIVEALCKTAAGPRPSLDNGSALVQYMSNSSSWTLLVVICDVVLMAALVIFFAGLRYLIKRSLGVKDWMSDVGFGAALVFVGMTLVGDSMDGGTALDAVQSTGNALVIRTLIESHILLFGPIGSVFIILITIAFGRAAYKARVIPKWVAVCSYIVAGLNAVAIPMVFRNISQIVDGTDIALFAIVSFVVWALLIGTILFQPRFRIEQALAAKPA